MSNTKLVSIIIPTYNVENYIKEAVNSILDQTYPNIEIIIVDDSSTDGTFTILKEYEKKHSSIKVFQNDKNRKISYTLNHALKYTSGDYIARMDGDDISALDRIEKQIDFLKNNPNIDLVGTHITKIDEDGNFIKYDRKITDAQLIKRTLLYVSPITHPSWMCKRCVYEQLSGYREVAPAEDYDFLLRMATEGFTFTNMDYMGLYLRLRKGNTASAQGLKQRKAVNYVLGLYNERVIEGKDSYSKEAFEKATICFPADMWYYNKSQKFSDKASVMRSKRNPFCLIYYLLAALLSKHQMQFLLRGFRYSFLK